MPMSASGRTSQKRQLKGDTSWEKGMFLGKTSESDEYLLGTKRGVHTARPRSSSTSFKECHGTP